MYPSQGHHPPYPYTYQHPQTSTTAAYPQLAYSPQEAFSGSQSYAAWSYGYTYPQFQPHPHPQSAQLARPSIAPAPNAQTQTPAPPAAQGQPPTTTTFSSYSPGYARDTTFSSYAPGYAREATATNANATAGTRGGRKPSHLKGLFAKELPKLMYGFGDDKQVSNDTVAVMEEMLIEYIVDVCQTALAPTRKTRLQIEDLRRALSRPADAKKLARMEELLFMQEDIKRARKQFEENEVGGGGGGVVRGLE